MSVPLIPLSDELGFPSTSDRCCARVGAATGAQQPDAAPYTCEDKPAPYVFAPCVLVHVLCRASELGNCRI